MTRYMVPRLEHCVLETPRKVRLERARTDESSKFKEKGAQRAPKRAMAGYAGLEPATSDVTGRRSNQLS